MFQQFMQMQLNSNQQMQQAVGALVTEVRQLATQGFIFYLFFSHLHPSIYH
jgi:hypothetical protein